MKGPLNPVALLVLSSAFVPGPAMSSGGGPAVAEELPRLVDVVNARADTVTWRGRRAIRLLAPPERARDEAAVLGFLDTPPFTDGTIDLLVAGQPREGAPDDARGFVGVSFRTGPRGEWSEVIYLRPTNGRADDQLRRNRSVQYASDPEYPWHRLRAEHPGAYESWVDLEPGAWTRMRLVIAGTTARLYVNDAAQPCLVVTDLKRGAGGGRVALWSHVQTEAYFTSVTISPS